MQWDYPATVCMLSILRDVVFYESMVDVECDSIRPSHAAASLRNQPDHIHNRMDMSETISELRGI